MSSYAEIKTSFQDPELLLAALEAMGYKAVENHIGSPQPLRGYNGCYRTRVDISFTDDVKRALHAEIIIRSNELPSGSNDIGFVRAEDGTFNIIPSNFDARQSNKAFGDKVMFNYAEQNIHRATRLVGLRPLGKPKVLADGRLQYQYAGR